MEGGGLAVEWSHQQLRSHRTGSSQQHQTILQRCLDVVCLTRGKAGAPEQG